MMVAGSSTHSDRTADARDFATARKLMVASQLRPSGVDDPRVIAAMAVVPRERFVPADRVGTAYSDRPVSLGGGRELNAPIVTARLLTELRVSPSDRALLVGAATGYAAALMTHLLADLVALEVDDALLSVARAELNDTDVVLVQGPLAEGHAAGAPYDVIMIDGAIDRVPDALIAQLAEGGRLAVGLIERGVARLAVGRKAGGGFGVNAFEDADPVRLPGFSVPRTFVF